MKIHLLSDLHNEFAEYEPDGDAIAAADVIVLAGDIGIGVKAVHWIHDHMPKGKPVLFVPGNHEYYRGDLAFTLDDMKSEVDAYNRLGYQFFLLDNQAVMLNDVQFVGATMWTDYQLSGNQPIAMYDAQQTMNDYRLIRLRYSRVHPTDLLKFHMKGREAVRAAVETGIKTIVITHHAPCELSIHPRYRDQKNAHINASFASNLDRLMADNVPLWVHGHTHDSFDYNVGATRVVCNPRGYAPDDVNPGFDGKLLLEV